MSETPHEPTIEVRLARLEADYQALQGLVLALLATHQESGAAMAMFRTLFHLADSQRTYDPETTDRELDDAKAATHRLTRLILLALEMDPDDPGPPPPP